MGDKWVERLQWFSKVTDPIIECLEKVPLFIGDVLFYVLLLNFPHPI